MKSGTWYLQVIACVMLVSPVLAGPRKDLLDMHAGAIVLSHPGQYQKQWPAMGLIDGTTAWGWSSSKKKPLPHTFTLELARTYALDTLVVDNSDNDEIDFPLLSAKDVVFSVSTESPNSGYKPLATVAGIKGDRSEMRLPRPVPARWLRVEIRSNYGNRRFTELMELEAYGEPVGQKPSQPDPTGHYVTNWEMLQVRKTGNELTGCYDLDHGYLKGWTDGRVLDFLWVEHEGTEKGEAIMVLASNGSFLNGLWYEQGILKGMWFGNRDLSATGAECDIDESAKRLGNALDTPGRSN